MGPFKCFVNNTLFCEEWFMVHIFCKLRKKLASCWYWSDISLDWEENSINCYLFYTWNSQYKDFYKTIHNMQCMVHSVTVYSSQCKMLSVTVYTVHCVKFNVKCIVSSSQGSDDWSGNNSMRQRGLIAQVSPWLLIQLCGLWRLTNSAIPPGNFKCSHT